MTRKTLFMTPLSIYNNERYAV